MADSREAGGAVANAVAPPAELRALTGLRAPAAFAVAAFHFALEPLPESAWLLRRLIGSGYVVVSLFFVLSGFVLAHRYSTEPFHSSRDFGRFWVRRFARVYPLYLLSLLIGAYAAWPKSMLELAAPREAMRLCLQLTLLNAWHHVAMFKWNWAAWSLSVEAAFYLAFPWVAVALRKLSTRRLLHLLIVCWAATFFVPALYTWRDPDGLGRALSASDNALFAWYLKFFPVHRFPEFIAGVATGVLYTRRRAAPSEKAGAALVIGGAAFLFLILVTELVPYAFLQLGALLPVFLALIMGLAVPRSIGRVFSCKPIWILGRASYATYILNVPLFCLMARFDRAMWTVPGHNLSIYGVVLVVVSLGAHLWIEEPCRRWLVHRGAAEGPMQPGRP